MRTTLALLSWAILALAFWSPAPARADGTLEENVAKFFERFDADKDGVVTPAEFDDAKMFERFDANGDGKITRDDFKPLQTPPKDPPKADPPPTPSAGAGTELMRRYDADKNGSLSREEMAANPRAFHALDKNADGMVDAAECAHATAAMLEPPKDAPQGGGGGDGMEMGGSREPASPGGPAPGGQRRPGMGAPVFDTDGDGKVSKEEWLKGQEQMFARLDKDGDGQLSAEEMAAMRPGQGGPGGPGAPGGEGANTADMAKRLFSRLDKNGDGAITRDEAPERLPFDQADLDKDGKITPEEYAQVASRFGRRQGQPGEGKGPGQPPAPPGAPGEPPAPPSTPVEPGKAPGGPETPPAGDSADRAKMFMEKLDKNGDGAITRDEAPEKLPFDMLDADKDGKITAEELSKLSGRLGRDKK